MGSSCNKKLVGSCKPIRRKERILQSQEQSSVCREHSDELIEASLFVLLLFGYRSTCYHLKAALTVTFSFGSRALVHPLSFNLLLLISTLLAEILSCSLRKAIAQTTLLQIICTLENNTNEISHIKQVVAYHLLKSSHKKYPQLFFLTQT